MLENILTEEYPLFQIKTTWIPKGVTITLKNLGQFKSHYQLFRVERVVSGTGARTEGQNVWTLENSGLLPGVPEHPDLVPSWAVLASGWRKQSCHFSAIRRKYPLASFCLQTWVTVGAKVLNAWQKKHFYLQGSTGSWGQCTCLFFCFVSFFISDLQLTPKVGERRQAVALFTGPLKMLSSYPDLRWENTSMNCTAY